MTPALHDGQAFALQDGRFALVGEIDTANAEHIAAALVELIASHPAEAPVWVDASGIRFIDSAGLNMLLSVREALAPRRVVLEQPAYVLSRLLEATGLDGLFGLDES